MKIDYATFSAFSSTPGLGVETPIDQAANVCEGDQENYTYQDLLYHKGKITYSTLLTQRSAK